MIRLYFLLPILFTVITQSAQFSPIDTLWQNNENTSTFLIAFSESMSSDGLTNPSNYSVTEIETNTPIPIQKIGIAKYSNNKNVAIITNRIDYKKTYHIVITGVKDISGNYIQNNNDVYYYFDGVDGTLKTSYVGINTFELPLINAYAKDTVQTTTLPYRAIDKITYNGSNTSEIWTSSPIPNWIVLELDKIRSVNKIDLSFSYFHDARVYGYTISYSTNKTTWTTTVPLTNSIANQEWVTHNVNISARYIRINFRTNNQGTWAGLYEAKIFGK